VLKVVHDGGGSNELASLGESLLDEIVRDGARRMLAAALQAEVAAYIGPTLARWTPMVTGWWYVTATTSSGR
jgi:hypothetical protein